MNEANLNPKTLSFISKLLTQHTLLLTVLLQQEQQQQKEDQMGI